MQRAKRHIAISAPRIMVLGFAGVILLGAILLMLPVSSANGERTSFLNALFTATTSVCVTGLVAVDTGTYWSDFGHAIILLLIQVGGLGVVTVAASFAMVSGRKIGLLQRTTMQEAVASPKMSGVVRLTGFILKATFLTEVIGAALMAPVFIRDFGWGRGIWTAIFTSVSAFCNAGIDLMGGYSSMTGYVENPLINITLMLLIVVGGLGFLTWDDIRSHGLRVTRYRTQSKVILVTTAALILMPAISFFFFEFGDMPLGTRVLASLFQAVTPRTAGYNTVDLSQMSQNAQAGIIGLMLIGGSPGSTAGGMKTTTFAVLLGCAYAVFRKRDSVQFFGRRIGQEVVATAATILLLYVGVSLTGAMIISSLEGLPLLTCWFETVSAVATVGLTLGITPGLGVISKCILIALMFLGRVGGLTLIFAVFSKTRKQMGKLPIDRITVG